MRRIFCILLFVAFIFPREVYKEVKVFNSSVSFLKSLSLDVDHIYKDENFLKFVVNDKELSKLNLYNVDFEILHDDIESFYASRLDNSYISRDFELGSMGGYYTYEEILNLISQLENSYPDLVHTEVIGTSLEGRDVIALKISDNAAYDEIEPEVLYTGLHHAREPMSYMNLFYYMDWLLENYSNDLLAEHLVNNRELWFVPTVNPDGLVYNQSIAPNGGGMQRKNMLSTCGNGVDGVDLNRNYSYMWAYDNEGSSPDGCSETYRGNNPFSEPESQNIRDFIELHDFPIALNYHSYSNLLIYPLGYEYNNPIPQEDLEIFIEYGQDMVQYNGYELGSGPELLYPVNGEACDWMYGEHDIFAYTPEIGSYDDGFWPQTSRIVPLAEENLYPNQFLATVAGSKYQLTATIGDGPYVYGDDYPIYITLFNQGMSASNGEVHIEIESSENLEFELEEVTLTDLDSREFIDLGGISYFSPITQSGSVESIIVKAYDNDGYIFESEEIQIIVGQTELIINETFESQSSWIVGDPQDNASAGIWELAVPNATYDEQSNLVQPDIDHTFNGTSCFLTQNSNNPNSPGQSDVDGGKTTLISPNYDLSNYSGAIFSYWKWFTNNQGNNPGNDIWLVQISNDGGDSWVDLENTTNSNNYWQLEQFYLNDFISLSSEVKFKFIAEDIYYDGDNGTGGSLIEAAVDDISISVFSFNSCMQGDLNSDDLVNIQDVVTLINLILFSGDDISNYLCAADINSDDSLNVQDIILLVNLILN